MKKIKLWREVAKIQKSIIYRSKSSQLLQISIKIIHTIVHKGKNNSDSGTNNLLAKQLKIS